MVCLACAQLTPGRICQACWSDMRPGAVGRAAPDLTVAAAWRHGGAARRLIHRLKYQGFVHAADVLGVGMVPLLPADTEVLVPVPRVMVRRLRYGVDPALALARSVSKRSGIPVVRALRGSIWWPRQAGLSRGRRRRPRFWADALPSQGAVLIDDVVTSGGTMVAASLAANGVVRLGITATSAGTIEPETPVSPVS